MPTLQLRLSRGESLAALAIDLTTRISQVLARHEECCQTHREDAGVNDILRRYLDQIVSSYAACGGRPACHTNLQKLASKSLDDPDRWPHYCPPDRQRILLFQIPDDLSRLYLDMEGELFNLVGRKPATACWLLLQRELDVVFRKTLGPYLYENPACEACPCCNPETRIDPWVEWPAGDLS